MKKIIFSNKVSKLNFVHEKNYIFKKSIKTKFYEQKYHNLYVKKFVKFVKFYEQTYHNLYVKKFVGL